MACDPQADGIPGGARRRPAGALVLVLAAAALLAGGAQAASSNDWQVVKSQHFLVHHRGDAGFAGRVAERAEAYYDTIAGDLGYTRRSGFWLWENRVRILVYPTADAFRADSAAPAWAVGRASGKRHEIAGVQADGDRFLTQVLPHEMAHLVLEEFVGERLPLWLSEGLAQWEQEGRRSRVAGGGESFALKDLMALDIRKEQDPRRVQVYYAQCASLVGFLVATQGGDRLGVFCRGLRDGKDTAHALAAAYPDIAGTLDDLERAWKRSLAAPQKP